MRKINLIYLISVFTSAVYILLYLLSPNSLAVFYNINFIFLASLIISIVLISKVFTTNKELLAVSVLKLILEIVLCEFLSKKNCNSYNVNGLNLLIENFFLYLIMIYYLKAKENLEKNPPSKISNEESLRRALDYQMKWYMRIPTIIIGLGFLSVPFILLFLVYNEMPKDIPFGIIIFSILIAFISFVLGILFTPIGILGKYPKFLIRFIAKYDTSLSNIENSKGKKSKGN